MAGLDDEVGAAVMQSILHATPEVARAGAGAVTFLVNKVVPKNSLNLRDKARRIAEKLDALAAAGAPGGSSAIDHAAIDAMRAKGFDEVHVEGYLSAAKVPYVTLVADSPEEAASLSNELSSHGIEHHAVFEEIDGRAYYIEQVDREGFVRMQDKEGNFLYRFDSDALYAQGMLFRVSDANGRALATDYTLQSNPEVKQILEGKLALGDGNYLVRVPYEEAVAVTLDDGTVEYRDPHGQYRLTELDRGDLVRVEDEVGHHIKFDGELLEREDVKRFLSGYETGEHVLENGAVLHRVAEEDAIPIIDYVSEEESLAATHGERSWAEITPDEFEKIGRNPISGKYEIHVPDREAIEHLDLEQIHNGVVCGVDGKNALFKSWDKEEWGENMRGMLDYFSAQNSREISALLQALSESSGDVYFNRELLFSSEHPENVELGRDYTFHMTTKHWDQDGTFLTKGLDKLQVQYDVKTIAPATLGEDGLIEITVPEKHLNYVKQTIDELHENRALTRFYREARIPEYAEIADIAEHGFDGKAADGLLFSEPMKPEVADWVKNSFDTFGIPYQSKMEGKLETLVVNQNDIAVNAHNLMPRKLENLDFASNTTREQIQRLYEQSEQAREAYKIANTRLGKNKQRAVERERRMNRPNLARDIKRAKEATRGVAEKVVTKLKSRPQVGGR